MSLSSFPNSVDVFSYVNDLPASENANMTTFKALIALPTLTSDQQTQLNGLVAHFQSIHVQIKASDINLLDDCVTNLETLILSTWTNYFCYKGVYSPTTLYNVANSVSFNGVSYLSLKQQTGFQPINDGINWLQNSTNATTYSLNIIGLVGSITYDANSANPTPTMTSLSCSLYANGVLVTPTSYSWTVPSSNTMISGSSTTSTFTPTIASNFNASSGNNVVTLTATYAGQTFIQYFPISINKIGTTGANGQNGLGLTYIGNYDSGTTYYIGNAFNSGNSIYYCTNTATAGTSPTNTSYFQVLLSNSGIIIQSTAPTSPYVNMIYVDSSTSQNLMKYWTGSVWTQVSTYNASNIAVTDSLSLFTATNVEDVLTEITGTGRTTETIKNTSDKVGTLSTLTTTDKTSTVNAINENANKISNLSGTGGNVEKANKTALDTTNTNLTSHLADNSKQVPHLGTTTNVGDAYSITTAETINVNQKFTITLNANSITAPTLKINSGTACSIKKANGNNAKLYASTYTLFWNGTSFIQLGEGGDYGTATPTETLTGYTIGTDNGVVPGTLALTGTAVATDIVTGKTAYSTDAKTKIIGTYSNIKSIQSGTVSFGSADITKTITISNVNVNACLVYVQFPSINQNANQQIYSIDLNNSTTITIARNTSGTASSPVYWFVEEYNNVKSFQSGITTPTTTPQSVTISSINPLKSKIVVSAQSTMSANFGTDDYMNSFRITGATTISLETYGGTLAYWRFHWQVIEFN